jgi:proteasome assembly chaperone (PAC2) family protein
MAFTGKDPHSAGEILRVVGLGIRIERRQARGKPTKRLENRVERIREKAQQREDTKRKKP